MGCELEEFSLGERCAVKSSKRIFAREYVEAGIPFFRSKDVIDKSLGIFSKYDLFISRERYIEIKKKFGSPKKGDVLISSVGNRSGQPYVVQDEGDFYFKDGNILWLSEFKGLDPYFLSYWLKSRVGQLSLESVMIGSAQKALTIDAIRKLSVKFPKYEHQRGYVKILTSLDDKIELNRQMNKTLEEMALALFKSWFVDFDPVIDNTLAAGNEIPEPLQSKAAARQAQAAQSNPPQPLPDHIRQQFPDAFEYSESMGWIPEGWEVILVGDVLELAYGKSLSAKARIPGEVPVYGSGGVTGYHSEAHVEGPGIVVGRKGTVGSVYWSETNFFPIDTVFYVRLKKEAPLYWVYQYLLSMNIKSLSADSAVPGVNRNAVHAQACIFPPDNVLGTYWRFINVELQKRCSLDLENNSLTKLRNTLLPKLLSGELRIPEAESLLQEVV